MRGDIFQYVRKCHLCQRAKPAQNTRVGLHNAEPPARPMDKVFVDLVGPLTRTKRGNSAILAILDGFSKFVLFYPVRKMSVQVAVDCLERSYFPAFGTPNDITDNAKVFRSKQVRHLCFRWGVKHITTTPYYPQDSLVERANRNLKAALKIFHHKSQNVWDEDLPWISAVFNTAKHESTNTTPDVLFLGRKIKSPLEAGWELPLKH
jgi:transposase InsO family protein